MARTLHRDITVIGGSAGSISALREMLGGLPADYPAAVFVVVHVSPEAPSVLHQILDRVCKLPVAVARSGARVRPGTVTLASPDLHLVLKDTSQQTKSTTEQRTPFLLTSSWSILSIRPLTLHQPTPTQISLFPS